MKKFTLLCIILISFSLGQIKNGPIIGKTNNKQIKTNKIEDLSSGVVPRRISYQGFLTKADGTPTIDGSYEILFRVYDNAEEGEPIWSESQLVNVSNGIISTVLGNTIPFSVIPENAYLELTVDGSTLSPRQLLTSVFYSILSDTSGYAKTANYDDLQNKPDLHVYVLKDSLESYTTSADLYDTLSYYQSLDSNLTDLTEDGVLSSEKVEYGINSPGSIGQSWISDGEGSGQWGVPASLLSDGDINIIPGDSSIIRLDSNLVVNNGVVGNEDDPDLVTFLTDTLKVSGAIVADNLSGDAVLDEDDMISDSDSKLATQQSIKAYVDTKLNMGSSLETISDLDLSDGNFIVADGDEWSVESDSVARNSLGLGSISTQDSVNINVDGGLIDGTIIGSENSSSATFTTLNSSEATLGELSIINSEIVSQEGSISFDDNDLTTSGSFNAGTGATIGNLALSDGLITDSNRSIDFVDNSLTTTGDLNAGVANLSSTSTIGNLTLSDGSITDSGGEISFGSNNLITSGTVEGGVATFSSGTQLGDITFDNGSIISSSDEINFGNDNLITTGNLSAGTTDLSSGSTIGTLTLSDGSITDENSEIFFGDNKLKTTGIIVGETGSKIGDLVLEDGSITDSSGTISFGNNNLSTTGNLSSGVATLESGSSIGDLTFSDGSITSSSNTISLDDENLTTTGSITATSFTGDGSSLTGVEATSTGILKGTSPIILEGESDNDFQTTLSLEDPTSDQIITFPDVTGTLITTANDNAIDELGTISSGTWQGTAVGDTYVADDLTVSGGTIDNSIIGGTTAAAGSFTSINGEGINLSADEGITLNNSETITNAIDGELLLTSPKTLASGDLSVGASLQTATIDFTDGDLAMTIADGGKVTSSGDFEIGTSLQTATIDYTDGDNAMTIEDGGGVTFPQEAQFTSGLETAGSVETATIDYTDGDNAMTIEDGGGVTFPQEAQFTSGLETAGSVETATIDYTDGDLAITIADGGDITTSGDITVTGDVTVTGNDITFGNGEIIDNTVNGEVLITADQSESALIFRNSSNSGVAAMELVSDNATSSGDGYEIKSNSGTFTVSSDHSGSGNYNDTHLTIAGNSDPSLSTTTIAGDLTTGGDLRINGNDIKSSDGSTSITLSGANTTIAGSLTSEGLATANANLAIKNGNTSSGKIELYEVSTNGSNKITLSAPSGDLSDITLTLPSSDGDPNQVLKTDGDGIMSWTDVGATNVTIGDNENENEINALVFTSGGDLDGGSMALESDGDATYNPSTGIISSSGYTGNTLIANTSLDIAGSAGLILENDETITNSTNGTVLITSPTTSLSGDLLVGTSVQAATIDYTDGDVALTIADGGAVTTSGNLTVGDNLSLGSDASVITLGDDSEVSITHVPDAGILIGGGNEIQFRDNGLKISSTTDGQLDIDADTEVEITANILDLNGELDVSGDAKIAGSIETNSIDYTDGDLAITISDGGAITTSGDATITGNLTVNGNISGSSITASSIAADNIDPGDAAVNIRTSSGAITVTSADDLNLDPASGSSVIIDGTIDIDAGVITGATSITTGTQVASTSILTPLIEFTDGDNAMTIADGGGVTFPQEAQFTGGLQTAGSVETATIDFTDGDVAMTIADGGKVTTSGDFEIGTSLQTATIDFTDGDVAMTIADGGGVTTSGDLAVTGDLTVTGNDITFDNGETISNATDGTVLITSPTTSLSGDLTVTGNDITFGNGETLSNSTDGTLNITSPTTAVSADLTVAGLATANANIAVKNGATSAGKINFYEDSNDGTEKLIMLANSMSSDVTLTLPSTDGDANQVLSTDGSGVMSWVDVSATNVTIADNENTNETNALVFTSDGDKDGGSMVLESDGDATYNPSTGAITSTKFIGNVEAATVTASTSLDITGSTGLILENDETITNATDGTVLINGIVKGGSGSAQGVFTSNGNQDVILKTGNGTTGSITITDGANENIAITPNGTGEVDISKVDIDAGAIDGTVIGAVSASTGAFTTVTTGTSVDITGSAGLILENDETITNSTDGKIALSGDLTVTGNDIEFGNGETISNATDGTVLITAPTTTVSSALTVTDDLTITGNDIAFGNGETISNSTDGTLLITSPLTSVSDNLKILDDKKILLGSDGDVSIQYDEDDENGLEFAADLEGQPMRIILKSDQGDDAGDMWELKVADNGLMTFGNDLNTKGDIVTHLTITPDATASNSSIGMAGDLTVSGNDIAFGNGETISNSTDGTLLITSPTTSLSGDLTVTGNDITFGNGETISNSTNGTVLITSPITTVSDALTVTGDLTVTGNDIKSSSATVLTMSGANVTTAGTLTSTGLTTANANIAVKNGATSAGKIDFYEDSDSGTEKLTLLPSAMSSDVTLTLPADDGNSNQVLRTDGSGVLSWVDVSATNVTIADNENTNETNALVFTAGGDLDGGSIGLESDGDANYNPSTGIISSTGYSGGTLVASTSMDITGSAGLILENDETITNATDGTVLINGIVKGGSGSANGVFTSNGNQDVILQTGNSTTGLIQITDGSNGNIAITPNGSGEVDISKVDIDGGAIDGTSVGATSASTGAFTTVTASTSMDITGSAGLILENDETITNASNGTLLFTAPTTKASAAFEADGLITADANIAVKNGSSTAGKIEFYEDSDDGSHKLTLLAAAMSGDVTLTLPVDDGSSNQFLKTDGNGAMTWADVSSNTLTITDNESTNESNALVFTAGGDVDGGTIGLESDGDATYNPSTGVITSTGYAGNTVVAGTSVDITGSAGLILENDETITNSTDGTVKVNGEVAAGTGSADGVYKSDGDYDVILKTGNSTTGLIQITDGSNGNITLAPNGSGKVIATTAVDITGSTGLILENDETITNASNGTLLFTAPTTKASAAFEADGLITADANIAVKNGSSTAGKIEFYEDSDDGSHKLTLLAAAMSGDVTLTLPVDDGSSNQVLKTDGNGAMSWTDVSSNTVNITDNESTNETNALVFTAGGDVDGGTIGLESDGDATYNPSTGAIAATKFIGNVEAATITASTSVDVTGSTGLILENDETITNSTDGTVKINGIVSAGTGSGNATFTSDGNYDVILKTGNSTTGSITIADGTNGNIAITPNGNGEVDISKVDIDAGAIDGTAIGANSANSGAFTTITASTSLDITGSTGLILENDETITNATNGTVKINGEVAAGTGGSDATFKSDGNYDLILKTGNSTTGSITIADGSNGNIAITPNGSGEVQLSKVNIDGGAIDATTVGSVTPSSGAFTTVTASTSLDITGSTGLILENDETITNAANGTVLINGIVSAGTGSGNATFKSNGNYDVILKTGNSTTGAITIADGADENISITPNGTGEVDISKVDIDGGAIDGTTVGAASASTGAFTTVTASTSLDITGSTGLILENDETITNSSNGTVLVTADITKTSADLYVESDLNVKAGFFKKTTVLTNGTSSNVTFSASNLVGGLILRDCGGSGRSDVTDTASNIVSSIPGCINGSSFEFYIKNTSDAAETITLTAGTNVSLEGTMTIAQSNTKKFLAVVTDASSAAVTIYSLGTSVH